jgi:heme-degrading monooxygenase HmoA
MLEVVSLLVRTSERKAFEEAISKAERLLPTLAGYDSHELRCSLERQDAYVLLIEWQALEDVTLGFRKSNAFERWHELLAGLVAQPPVVQFFGPAKSSAPTAVRGTLSLD